MPRRAGRSRSRPRRTPGFCARWCSSPTARSATRTSCSGSIRERLGDRRLFTVGIGSAPNALLHAQGRAVRARHVHLHRRRRRGRGEDERAVRASSRRPVLTDVAIDWPARRESLADASCPTSTPASRSSRRRRSRALDGEVVVRGRCARRAVVDAAAARPRPAARRRRRAVGARRRSTRSSDAQAAARPEARSAPRSSKVALAHHLVSQYTSLVAVDVTPIDAGGHEP